MILLYDLHCIHCVYIYIYDIDIFYYSIHTLHVFICYSAYFYVN